MNKGDTYICENCHEPCFVVNAFYVPVRCPRETSHSEARWRRVEQSIQPIQKLMEWCPQWAADIIKESLEKQKTTTSCG